MATRRQQQRWANQSAQESLVRFGPEIHALAELLSQAQSNRDTGVRQAKGTARAITHSINRARPQVRDVYEDAGLEQARGAETLISGDLAGLSNVADSIKGAAALESQAQAERLREAQAAALTDLSQQRVQAQQGRQFGIQNAQGTFESEVAKILGRAQSLAQEQGAFESAIVGQLRDAFQQRRHQVRLERMGNRQSERNSLRSEGIDPDTMQPIPGGKLDPAAKKGERVTKFGEPALSRERHQDFQSKVDEIIGHINAARQANPELSRQQLITWLQRGRPQANGQPGRPQYAADATMTAALDVALDKHLSRATQKKLQRSGFLLRELGFPTYGQWRRATRQGTNRMRQRAGENWLDALLNPGG